MAWSPARPLNVGRYVAWGIVFETSQLLAAFAFVAVLALVGFGLLVAGGLRRSKKMALVGAFFVLGAGTMLMLAHWYAAKCDDDREAETRVLHVAE